MRFVTQHHRARAVAKQTGADDDAGIVIEKKRGTANFDADGQNFFRPPGGKQSFGGPQVWQSRAAALADEVESEHVGAQAETFADIAGEAGAEVTGASADENGVNFRRRTIGIGEGALCGFGCERGSVFREAGVQNIRSQIKGLGKRVQSNVTCGDAVIAVENLSYDRARTGFEFGE